MKRFLIILMLLLATCSVGLSQSSSKRKASTRMSGITIRGNVLHFTSAWQVEKKGDVTYLFKKKRIVLVVKCKCSVEGGGSGCVLSREKDTIIKCVAGGCGGTCGVVTDIIKTTAPEGPDGL